MAGDDEDAADRSGEDEPGPAKRLADALSGDADEPVVPTIEPSTVWTLVGVTGTLFLLGTVLGLLDVRGPVPPILFSVAGALFVASLVLGAIAGRDLPESVRIGMAFTAGAALIGWALALWWGWQVATRAAAWTCGTAIALPSISALWGAIGVKGFLLKLWGIDDPASGPVATGSAADAGDCAVRDPVPGTP